jgi:hypothetical protein
VHASDEVREQEGRNQTQEKSASNAAGASPSGRGATHGHPVGS